MKKLIIIHLLIVLINCKDNNFIEYKIIKGKNVTIIDSDHVQNEFLSLKSEKIYGEFLDIAVIDTLLICGNLRSPNLLNIYSLNSKNLLHKLIARGNSKNEGLSVSKICISDDKKMLLSIYDITLSKFFEINLDSLAKGGNFQKEIELNNNLKNMISPTIINNNTILFTTYKNDTFRYAYSTTERIIKQVGELPKIHNTEKLKDIPKTKFPNRASIFKSILVRHPNKNNIIIFYNKTNRIELYQNDKLLNIINFSKNFNPKMFVNKQEKGYIVDDCDITEYAYLSVTHDSNYIYALYSGSTKTSSEIVHVFDWNGKLIKLLNLKMKISDIFIHKNRLYCYNSFDKGIYSSIIE